MHLGLDAAPTVIATPSSPQSAAEVLAGLKRFVAWRDDGMDAAIGDCIMAFSGILGAVCSDAADLLVRRDLVEQIWQHRCISDMAPGDLDGPNFQRLLVDPEVNLAPDPPFGAAMFAGVPLALTLDLDPCAVDQQIERALGTAIRDVHCQGLLTRKHPVRAVVRQP